MSSQHEDTLIEKHYVELIRESAQYYEKEAFTALQFAEFPNARFAAAEAMEVWKSVQILLAQRDKLAKYVRLWVKTGGDEHAANAARGYLEKIGIEL